MKQRLPGYSRSGREGIALIAVLGFLSVLILMAVAFLMNMRTERLVAESSKDDVRTRQLARSALASAMDSIDGFLDSPSGLRVRMPLNYAVFESTDGTTSLGNDVDLISGEVTNWLPRHFHPGGQFDAQYIEQTAARWVLVHDHVTDKILGRYAFLAMDCTGMMDVNLVTNPATRGEGRTIAEVDSQFLPEVGTVESALNLFRSRATNYTIFGTFPEIVNLSGLTRPINNLIPYSLCYDSGWWDGSKWMQTGIGYPPAPINVREWSQADAERVFRALGYPNAADMAVCFQDYVDTDDLPGGGWNMVSCEAFPMINEITASNRIYDSGGGYATHEVVISVELWYPYVGVTNTKEYEVRFVGADWSFSSEDAAVSFTPDTLAPPQTFTYDPIQRFPVVSFVNSVSVPTTNFLGVKRLLANAKLKNVQIEVWDGGALVDKTVNQDRDLRLGSLLIRDGLPQNAKAATWVAVNDPRLNHLSAQWSRPQVSTMNAINANVDGFGISASGDPEGTNMFVRNSTNLLSVAELGFIPTGLPWTTIDLFSPEGMDLLAKFRATINLVAGARIYTNGLVNPNTLYTNVLMAVFRDTPINDYPGGPAVATVDSAMAADIVESVYANGTSNYDSAAGWVTTEAFRPGGTLSGSPYDMNNTRKESIIRNSCQLFNPNQQLFTIVVVAQSINDHGVMGQFDGEDIDVVVGEKRAVALVWRDPFPGPSGRHEMFVKLFKYLDE